MPQDKEKIIQQIITEFDTTGTEKTISDIDKVNKKKKESIREARRLEKLQVRMNKYETARTVNTQKRILRYSKRISKERTLRMPALIPEIDYRTNRQIKLESLRRRIGAQYQGEGVIRGFSNRLALPYKTEYKPIPANRAMVPYDSNRTANRHIRESDRTSKLASFINSAGFRMNSFQNKYVSGLRSELSIKKKLDKQSDRSAHGSRKPGGRMSGSVSRAMLYMGFGSLASYMVRGGVDRVMQLGDAAASTELDVLKGKSYREHYGEKYGDTKGFDEASMTAAMLTGEGMFKSRSRIADIAGGLEAANIDMPASKLKDIAIAAQGISTAYDRDTDTAYKDIIGMLTARRTPEEVGFIGLKGGGSPEVMLGKILDHLKKNPSLSGILGQQTLKSTMQSIRNAPLNMISGVYNSAPTQSKSGMNAFSRFTNALFDVDSEKGLDRWGRTMASINMSIERVADYGGPAADALAGIAAGSAQILSIATVHIPEIIKALAGIFVGKKLWKGFNKIAPIFQRGPKTPLIAGITKAAPVAGLLAGIIGIGRANKLMNDSIVKQYAKTPEEKEALMAALEQASVGDMMGEPTTAPVIINAEKVFFDSENRISTDENLNNGGR